MSLAEFTAPRDGSRVGLSAGVGIRSLQAPGLVLSLLLALTLVAVFDHGAVDEAASARIEVAAVLIALLAVGPGSGVARCGFAARAPACSRWGGGLWLLAAFCVWSAVSLAWSIAPDRTWLEFNRAVLYVLCLMLAVACGASWWRAPRVLASGLVWVGAAVCAYALGQKLVPGVHIGSLLNLDQTGAVPRLQEPLGYWNALALLLSLIAPLALMRAADPEREDARPARSPAPPRPARADSGADALPRRPARPRRSPSGSHSRRGGVHCAARCGWRSLWWRRPRPWLSA